MVPQNHVEKPKQSGGKGPVPGIKDCLDNIDRVIALIRKSKNDQIAGDSLMREGSGLTEKRAEPINRC